MVDWNEKKKDVCRFFDFWNKVGFSMLLILSFYVILAIIHSEQKIFPGILIIVTGLYVFTAFNQMREARTRTYTRPVQRDIDYSVEHDAEVPGIRNFGSEPVYDLEFLASFESAIDDKTTIVRENTQLKSPTTLQPDEFVPVIGDRDEFKEDLKNVSRLKGGKLSIYYAYSTPSIHRVPSDEEELLKKDLTTLQEEYPDPTSFEASSLQEQCFPVE